jgi:hypothetical protein
MELLEPLLEPVVWALVLGSLVCVVLLSLFNRVDPRLARRSQDHRREWRNKDWK